MTKQFQLVSYDDLARGIDQRSSENVVGDGYAELLENVETNSEGFVSKRKGYQGYAGYVPFRIREISHSGYQIIFKLETGVDLSSIVSGPLLLQGRLPSSQTGDFSTADSIVWYPDFTTDVRTALTTPSGTIVVTAGEHGNQTENLFVDMLLSTSETNNSSSYFFADEIRIEDGASVNPYQVEIDFTTGGATRAFIIISNEDTVTGSSYVDDNKSAPIAPSAGVVSKTVTSAVHQLENFRVIPFFYDYDGATTYTRFLPDSFTIDTATGDLDYSFTSASSFDGKVIFSAAPITNLKESTVLAGETKAITITGLDGCFPYVAVYDVSGSTRSLVIPDSITVDDATDTMTVTYTNGALVPKTVEIYWKFATLLTNQIKVVDSTATKGVFSPTETITDPQLTLWGIAHSGKYTASVDRGGHVVHIDSYKREAEKRLVTGLGGAFYAERSKAEVGSTFLLPDRQANVTARADTATRNMAPLFRPDGTTDTRTRGLITGTDIDTSGARVSSATYISSGVVDYTIPIAGKVGTLVLSDSNTPAGSDAHVFTSDFLTVSGMAHDQHNGEFRIISVVDSASDVTIRVTNTNVVNSIFNETGARGVGNVFTDRITTDAVSSFLSNDTILFDEKPSGVTLTVDSVVEITGPKDDVTVKGVTEEVEVAGGLALFASRQATVVPLKNSSLTADVSNIIIGDMLSKQEGETLTAREFRVTMVNTFQDLPLEITVAAGVATANSNPGSSTLTISSVDTGTDEIVFGTPHGLEDNDPVMISTTENLPDGLDSDVVYFVEKTSTTRIKLLPKEDGTVLALTTTGSGTLKLDRIHNLSVGQKILVRSTGDSLLEGEITVASVPSSSTFTYATTSTTTPATGIMVGKSVELDEEITYEDGFDNPTLFTVERRWIPVEAPENVDDLPKSTYVSHFDSSNTIRSTIVGGNMYFTNQVDEVMKFDGTDVYRAGLFRWQPQLFVQVDTSVSSLVESAVVGNVQGTTAGNKFVLATGEAIQFVAGDRISHDDDDAEYVVQSVDTTNDLVFVTTSITGAASGDIKLTKQFKYYFRLNAIDANNNVIASAATGADDFVVDLTSSGQIKMRLVGFPVWDNYDYDRIELQVYRTLANTSGPYFLIQSIPVSFAGGDGYIDVTDSTPDALLEETLPFDDTMRALIGNDRIGETWEEPPRAKYMTSANNSLILANLRGYPKLDIVLRKATIGDPLTPADLEAYVWLFRRDAADASTTPDMRIRAAYEYTSVGEITIDPLNDISRTATTFTITDTSHTLAVGNWAYLFHDAEGEDNELEFAGWYQVSATTGTTFSFNSNKTLSSFTFVPGDVADDGGGNLEITETSHGLLADNIVRFSTDTTLPTNLSAGVDYYVIVTGANTFQVSLTPSTGPNTPIAFVDGGTGTHTTTLHVTDTAAQVNRYVSAPTNKNNVPVWLGTDGNHNEVFGNTTSSFEFQAVTRLAAAINASMRLTDTTLTGQETFTPWMIAEAGSSLGTGEIIVRQPRSDDNTFEVKLGTITANFEVFVNNILRTSDAEIAAVTILAPSRLAVSYPNHPEIMDNPEAILQEDSDSVVDVNSADGEEITGVIPFFGSASFGGGQVESVIIVFKTNSIYLLDISRRDISTGGFPIQKIESQGLGCTAPFSIAPTRNGIMFANNSGVYRLNRDLTISYAGQYVERIWRDTVNRTSLESATGHHFSLGRQYKLSVPTGTATTNSNVLVYDHTREGQEQVYGAWSSYTNHAATGWANLENDAFFATTSGEVFKIRRANDATDYRDDASAVDNMVIRFKALDAGMSGVRKVVQNVISHFRMDKSSMTSTVLQSAVDLSTTFESAGNIVITLGDKKVQTLRSSIPTRRFTYLQLEYTNSTKDEEVILAGIDLLVAALTSKGIVERAEVAGG